MKKNIAAIGVVALILSGGFFIQLEQTTKTIIAAPIINVSAQLIHPEKWKKWNTNLKSDTDRDTGKYSILNNYNQHSFTISTQDHSISVVSPSGNLFEISDKKEAATNNFTVSLYAGNDSKRTTVITKRNISLFTKFFLYEKSKSAADSLVYSLKKFMETDYLYYGFPIEIKKVTDSIVIVLNRHIPQEEKFLTPPLMIESLKDYSNDKRLIITQPLMLEYTGLTKDSISVLTMLSVNKKVPNKDKIRCMQMPIKGRMLVGYYKGKFKDRIQLQIAMQQYILDKNLNSIVGSYEKYLDNKLPKNENDPIEIEMYFPIL